MIYDRANKKLVGVNDYGQHRIQFLYSNPVGRLLLRFVSSKTYSKLNALHNDTKRSARKITAVEKSFHIDASEYESRDFKSFNDFFTRKLKTGARPFSHKGADFISPADSKMIYKEISDNLELRVKGASYSLGSLIENDDLAEKYAGGLCLIFRLTMDDCHRYIFPDDGRIKNSKTINGKLHTVQPNAHEKYKSYISNYRIISELETKHFDDILFIEIGALLVGKINNHKKSIFRKGDEKGYFGLGGSTIIIITKCDIIKIDDDIRLHSRKNIETKVKQGETIGDAYA